MMPNVSVNLRELVSGYSHYVLSTMAINGRSGYESDISKIYVVIGTLSPTSMQNSMQGY